MRAPVVALALWVLFLEGCRRQEENSSILEGLELKCDVGVNRLVVADEWQQVRVRLRSAGPSFRGALRLQGVLSFDGGEVWQGVGPVFEAEVEVPGQGGAFRELVLPLQPGAAEALEISLDAGGQRRSIRVPLNPQGATYPVLVVTEKAFESGVLQAQIQEPLTKGTRDMQQEAMKVAFTQCPPSDLPLIREGLDPFRAVILHQTALEDAAQEPARIAALEAWIRAGGTLVALGGSAWQGGRLAPELLALFGVAEVRSDGSLAPAASARGIRLEGDIPAVERSLGMGRITSLGSALPVDPALLAPLTLRGYFYPACSARASGQLKLETSAILSANAITRPPRVGTVFLALTGYIVLGLVLPYLVFKKSGKPERAFLWLLGAALLCVGAILGLGALTAVSQAVMYETSVVQRTLGGEVVAVDSVLAMTSPGFRRLDMESGLRAIATSQEGNSGAPLRARLQPFDAVERWSAPQTANLGGAGGNYKLDGAGRWTLAPLTLYPNSLTMISASSSVSAPAPFTVRPGAGDQKLLRNTSQAPLVVAVLQGTLSTPWSTVAPGEEASLPDLSTKGAPIRRQWGPWGQWNVDQETGSVSPEELIFRHAPTALRDALALPWTTGRIYTPAEQGEELPPELLQAAPVLLLVAAPGGVFPVPEGFQRGPGCTLHVLELPPDSQP